MKELRKFTDYDYASVVENKDYSENHSEFALLNSNTPTLASERGNQAIETLKKQCEQLEASYVQEKCLNNHIKVQLEDAKEEIKGINSLQDKVEDLTAVNDMLKQQIFEKVKYINELTEKFGQTQTALQNRIKTLEKQNTLKSGKSSQSKGMSMMSKMMSIGQNH